MSKSPKTPARLSLKSLQAELARLESRLKTTERKTRDSIAQITADYDALGKASKAKSAAGRGALTRRVNALTKTLDAHIETQSELVARTLASALDNPNVDAISDAVSRTHAALDASDAAHAAALSKVNRNIADLARAVDARLSDEAKARQAAMAAMQRAQDSQFAGVDKTISRAADAVEQRLTLRLHESDQQNAQALQSLGEKVIAVTQDIKDRSEDGETLITERINEIALNTQAEFDSVKAALERRITALEDNLRGTDSHIDRSVQSLTSRVESLEYGMTAPAPVTAPATLQVAASSGDSAAETMAAPEQDAFSPPIETPAPYAAMDATQQMVAPPPAPQAIAPEIPVMAQAPMDGPPVAVPYNPSDYATAAPQAIQTPVAQPYTPEPYVAQPYSPPQYEPPQVPEALAGNPYAPAQSAPPHPAPSMPMAAMESAPQADIAAMPVDTDPLPYADPAYAETDQSMESARPGVFKSKRKAKKVKTPKKPKSGSGESVLAKLRGSSALTPRTVRLGAMVAGAGILALVATQTVLKPNAPALPSGAPMVASDTAPTSQMADLNTDLGVSDSLAASQPLTVSEPIESQYADNKATPVIGAQASALEQAAASGNAVAQLQLGLSQLASGQTESAVSLIRASANQDQPAALYRLAKLYETGQGVTKDAKTARELAERSARAGNRIAMHDLGNYYVDGLGGVNVDMAAAAKWFQDAAQRGVIDSQYNLGIMYERGQGVAQSPELAYYWYSIAAGQGDQTAAARVTILKNMLPADTLSATDARIKAFRPTKINPVANGIFDNMPWMKNVTQTAGMAKPAIVQTQTLLGTLGYDVGAPDGAIGPKTRAAIMSFERANGLPETGRVNAALVSKLELAAGV